MTGQGSPAGAWLRGNVMMHVPMPGMFVLVVVVLLWLAG